jgi:glycine C-acetyltransferase
MSGRETFLASVREILARIEADGLAKQERPFSGPQGAHIRVGGASVLNLCSNNYLGLANHPRIVRAAQLALEHWGFGLSSVRFICGTQELHRELEEGLSAFLGTEDTILYSSCFDANGGAFETLLSAEDAIVSDELNHASIIDGIRLCRARRVRYRNCDLADLEAKLREADLASVRHKLIVTDGVFSMDGTLAPLRGICDLAERFGALVMVDDSHAVGFLGQNGRGSHEEAGVLNRVDLLSGTLGKALGGASGGYLSGRREIIALLRQRSRPYLFSNSLAPMITAAALEALRMVSELPELRQRLRQNTAAFRGALAAAGVAVKPGAHPIVPILVGEGALAKRFAGRMLERGFFVTGFFYPVVPEGAARIRTQVSAAHSPEDLARAAAAIAAISKELAIG